MNKSEPHQFTNCEISEPWDRENILNGPERRNKGKKLQIHKQQHKKPKDKWATSSKFCRKTISNLEVDNQIIIKVRESWTSLVAQ